MTEFPRHIQNALARLRAAKQREAYSRLVLKAWDDADHADKRDTLDRKAEVQIKARERL